MLKLCSVIAPYENSYVTDLKSFYVQYL